VDYSRVKKGESMSVTNSQKYSAPRPTEFTLFLRTFLPWQFLRFIVINIKMTVMIVKSHGRRLAVTQKSDQDAQKN
jgi:hypothetical protein